MIPGRYRLRLRAAAAAAGVGLALSACTGTPAPQPTAVPVVTTAVPSSAAAVPRGLDPYAEPCQRVAALAGEWVELAVRAAESQDLAADVTRPEVESLINRLTAVQPYLPQDVYPLVLDLVDPLVRLRGVLLTGVDAEIVFGPGRDNVPVIFQRCAEHVPPGD